MKASYIALIIYGGFLCTCVQSTAVRSSSRIAINAPRRDERSAATHPKRDISLSYTATDIDSKQGTRFKTITVIKNLENNNNKDKDNNNKQTPLTINPELHKSEEWATAFRDNFNTYGTIPDVPDIDELFQFVKKKPKPTRDEMFTKMEAAPPPPPPSPPPSTTTIKPIEKPVYEPPQELKGTKNVGKDDDAPVEKIKGDAELLPGLNRGNKRRHAPAKRSQSLALDKKSQPPISYNTREPLIHLNYSTPMHKVHQYFDKYVQLNGASSGSTNFDAGGYDYPKPCAHANPKSIAVTTPAGRSYDHPVEKQNVKPYLAPAITKKSQSPSAASSFNPSTNAPSAFSVNSLITSQRQQPSNNNNDVGGIPPTPPLASLQPPRQLGVGVVGGGGGGIPSSTQRNAYVAPNLRNGLGSSRGPGSFGAAAAVTGGNNYRNNVFAGGANRPNIARSRGLKY